jgi:hypothetical protein
MTNLLSAKNASLIAHAASPKSSGYCCSRKDYTWWMRVCLPLAALLSLRNIVTSTPYMKLFEEQHPVKEFANLTIPIKEPPQECIIRDLSNYTAAPVRNRNKGGKTERYAHCLRFQCMDNISKCDNPNATNFDGPDPPCCVHILRDMAREFDRVMCYLGLEYLPAFGMLLGLARSDRLIPWTSDNDYMISTATMMAMLSMWDHTSHLEHGLSLVYDDSDRMCGSPSFANGRQSIRGLLSR